MFRVQKWPRWTWLWVKFINDLFLAGFKSAADLSKMGDNQLNPRKKAILDLLNERKKIKETLIATIDKTTRNNFRDISHDVLESLKISKLPNNDKAYILARLRLREQILNIH